jgi:hypothetical protein
MTFKHIVMWNVRAADAAERARHIALLKTEFESLRGRIPGLLQLEVGVDDSRIDYACDVVLYSEFVSRARRWPPTPPTPSTCACASTLGDLRTARHQVDYESPARQELP